MAKMKVKDFIAKAIEVEKVLTLYKLGAFMNKKDGKHLLCDCSGLIKGILWGYPSNGKYACNGVPDINANTMITQCSKVSTNFNKLAVGALVWMEGHIGIHVGNGVCVESSPIWEDGIQCTFIRGSGYSNTRKLKERTWSKQGLFDKYIDYSTTTPTPSTPSASSEQYTLLVGCKVYKTAKDAKNHTNAVTTYSAGTYYVYKKVDGMINVTKKKGTAGAWINPGDNGTPSVSYYAKYNGSSNSIVDALKALKIDDSFANRQKIAKANGLTLTTSNSANVNSELLKLLKQGKLKK